MSENETEKEPGLANSGEGEQTGEQAEEKLEVLSTPKLLERTRDVTIFGYEERTGSFGPYFSMKIRIPNEDGEKIWNSGSKVITDAVKDMTFPQTVTLFERISKSGRKYHEIRL